jgi:hypothetical protein
MPPQHHSPNSDGLLSTLLRHPRDIKKALAWIPSLLKGCAFGRRAFSGGGRQSHGEGISVGETTPVNPLRDYFEKHQTGKGIWKWEHYFEIYHRHFAPFRGKEVNIVEIGIYSGGSLDMWRDYFGDRCKVFGVDIEDACRSYQNEYTEIFIGDQASPEFWEQFKIQVPRVDILIDDGGHQPHQQIPTFEAMFEHIRPGGVYLCEDIHGENNHFVQKRRNGTSQVAKNLNPAVPGERAPKVSSPTVITK